MLCVRISRVYAWRVHNKTLAGLLNIRVHIRKFDSTNHRSTQRESNFTNERTNERTLHAQIHYQTTQARSDSSRASVNVYEYEVITFAVRSHRHTDQTTDTHRHE